MVINEIAVVSTSRSGSNWLIQLLDSSEKTRVYGEIGKKDFLKTDAGASRIAADLGLDIESLKTLGKALPSELVEQLRSKCKLDEKAFGCKLFYYHIDKNNWAKNFLASKNTKVIHLFRNNIFDTYTSLTLARESNNWLGDKYPDMQLEFNEKEYVEFRKFVKKNFSQWSDYLNMSKNSENLLNLEYSKIGEDITIHILGEFLGIDDFSIPVLQKQSTKPAASYWKYKDSIVGFAKDRLTD